MKINLCLNPKRSPQRRWESKNFNGDVKLGGNIVKNISLFINGKKNNKETEKLFPVYVTENEKMEGAKLENKTIKELKTMIFEKINLLPTEQQELQEEIYEKTVKNKKKNQFITFYQIICELEENGSIEKINEIAE